MLYQLCWSPLDALVSPWHGQVWPRGWVHALGLAGKEAAVAHGFCEFASS